MSKILSEPIINLKNLREFCWQGIPNDNPKDRSEAWKFLLGFYPLNQDLKASTVKKKREEYSNMCSTYSNALSNPTNTVMNDQELGTYRQIQKDVPRTLPEYPMFQNETIKFMMTRVLYIWSMRHPASGYVQGLNDLTTPFFIVFFLEYFPNCDFNGLLNKNLDQIKENVSENSFFDIETDIYFSLTKLLDRIQTNYTNNQPGIKKMMKSMEQIIKTVDEGLYNYLIKMEIDYIQFCFRWMNCFLMREFSLNLVIRLWDTYFSEENAFSEFHLYVCACLLLSFSEKLKKMTEFQEMIMFLQKLPTATWTEKDIEILLAKSYQIKELYSNKLKN